MNFFKKAIKKDPIDILAENYFQCIYYLTVTDYGDGQDLSRGSTVIPEDIKVDEQDMLLIHSSIGVYNLHLIDCSKRDFLSKCVRKITDMVNSSNVVIPIKQLNKKLQHLVFSGW
ncbi:MAG: hypothetical protein K2L12_05205 [Clostridia bacterium]|nr:hypothetical protein [Clostridia bacterium]